MEIGGPRKTEDPSRSGGHCVENQEAAVVGASRDIRCRVLTDLLADYKDSCAALGR